MHYCTYLNNIRIKIFNWIDNYLGDSFMNRKRLALLTSLTILINGAAGTTNLFKGINTAQASTTKIKRSLSPNKKYPDINKELDLTSMAQYSSENLYMNVTLKSFYIKDLGTDENGKYYLLLTPFKSSNQYFFVNFNSSNDIKKYQKISIQGFLNGKKKLGNSEIDTGLNTKYLNKKVVTLLPDNIVLYK